MDDKLVVAHQLASEWHEGEVRKYTGTPYIVHPEAVARLIRSIPHTWEDVAAALLHDVLECDEAVSKQRASIILSRLGPEVLSLVLEVTNPSKAGDGNRLTRKAIDRAHLAKASAGGQTLRLADAIDNLESLSDRDPRFARDYAREKLLIMPLTLQGNPTLHARAAAAIEKILSTGSDK